MGASVTERDVIVTLNYYTNPSHLSIVQRDLKLPGLTGVWSAVCVCVLL